MCLSVLIGLTKRSLSKFHVGRFKNKVVSTWSARGWSTTETMLFVINKMILPHSKGRLCALTWDTYASHLADKVVAHAHKNNIQLIPCPPGGTKSGTFKLRVSYL